MNPLSIEINAVKAGHGKRNSSSRAVRFLPVDAAIAGCCRFDGKRFPS
jgi:hypothetical protein